MSHLGTLAASFGSGGRLLTNNIGRVTPKAIARQGTNILLGTDRTESLFVEPLTRITASGDLDATVTGSSQVLDRVDSLIVLADRILVAGPSANFVDRKYVGWQTTLVAQFGLDGSFKKAMSTTLYPADDGPPARLLQDSNGRFLVAGKAQQGPSFYVSRFDKDLNRDTAFGDNGSASVWLGDSMSLLGIDPELPSVGIAASDGANLAYATALP